MLARLVAILALAAMAGTGCGPGSSGSSAQPVGPPKSGGSVTFGLRADISASSLDPIKIFSDSDGSVAYAIYDRLIDRIGDKGELGPMLADSWQMSDDLKTCTLKLHPGVTFHDGTPFNADAVVFNVKRHQDPASITRADSLLIADVTLTRQEHVTAQIRLRGGQTATLQIAVRLPAPEARRTPGELVAKIDELLDHHTEAGVAEQLNSAGIVSGTGETFHVGIVHHIRVNYRLIPREQRLAARGLVNLEDAATRLGVCATTVKTWHHEGRLKAEPLNQKGQHYYQIPAIVPRKAVGRPAGTKNRRKK